MKSAVFNITTIYGGADRHIFPAEKTTETSIKDRLCTASVFKKIRPNHL